MAEEQDGIKAIKEKLNADLLKLSKELSDPSLDYQFTLDRISEISKTLKKLPKEEKPKEKKTGKFVEPEEKEGSFLDRTADGKRK